MYLSKSNPLATLVDHLTEFVVMDARDLETLHRHTGISFPGSPRLTNLQSWQWTADQEDLTDAIQHSFQELQAIQQRKVADTVKDDNLRLQANPLTHNSQSVQKHYDTKSSLSKSLKAAPEKEKGGLGVSQCGSAIQLMSASTSSRYIKLPQNSDPPPHVFSGLVRFLWHSWQIALHLHETDQSQRGQDGDVER